MLATTPRQMPGRSRKTGIWVSPWVNQAAIIDTRALLEGESEFAGPDPFPADCLLVVVNPETNAKLVDAWSTIPASGPMIAAVLIDEQCRGDETLADRLDWKRSR